MVNEHARDKQVESFRIYELKPAPINRPVVLICLLFSPLVAMKADDEFSVGGLALTAESASQLERAQRAGVIEIAPVHLPLPDASDCNHYG
jgi:hypothetical protein